MGFGGLIIRCEQHVNNAKAKYSESDPKDAITSLLNLYELIDMELVSVNSEQPEETPSDSAQKDQEPN